MVIIPVHVGKNLVEDVLLDGGSSVNIITEDLRGKKNTYLETNTLYLNGRPN
jgi:hypothetical protein